MVTLSSTISSACKRKALFRGSAFAGVGFLLLGTTGVYGTVSLLQSWGVWIFGLSIGAIALGLLPYRRLCQLETCPHRITIEPEIWTVVIPKKTVRFSPKAIQAVRYVEAKRLYGITLTFHSGQSDLFLPFFSREAYEQLTAQLYRS